LTRKKTIDALDTEENRNPSPGWRDSGLLGTVRSNHFNEALAAKNEGHASQPADAEWRCGHDGLSRQTRKGS